MVSSQESPSSSLVKALGQSLSTSLQNFITCCSLGWKSLGHVRMEKPGVKEKVYDEGKLR